MALSEVMTLKANIGKLQGKLQNEPVCVSDMYEIVEELKSNVNGPLMDSIVNEDNVNTEDSYRVLFEVVATCLDLVRAVLGKVEDLEADTVIPNLKNKLEETNTEIKTLHQKLKEMSKKHERQLQAETKKHEDENRKFKHDIEVKFSEFAAMFKRVEDELKDTKRTLATTRRKHEDEIKGLKGKLETLTCNENILMVGQLAFEIEKEIIEKVLGDCAYRRHNIHNLDQMIDAIQGRGTLIDIFKQNPGDDGKATQRKAKEKWDQLKSKLDWKHSSALRAVKNLRRGHAHPPFNLQLVEDTIANGSIQEIESDTETKYDCQELIKVYKQLKAP